MRRSSPKVVDLFSGVGGLSLGAMRAGLTVALAVDTDPITAKTHRQNFPRTAHSSIPVQDLSSERLLNLAGVKQNEIWGILGGPPCQGFSLIGKREVADERNMLFKHFFRLVKETQPAFFVAENVPGILGDQYTTLREEAIGQVSNQYSLLKPLIVCASEYGAPTSRTRVLFIGYDSNRIPALTPDIFKPKKSVKPVLVRDAFRSLPKKILPEDEDPRKGWRRLSAAYEGSFAERLSKHVPANLGYQTALRRFTNDREVSGCIGTAHTAKVRKRFSCVVPGAYDEVSNAIRLELTGLCPTLRAGTGTDHGSFQSLRPIHPTEDRVITPREAARLQGFPDWFYFHPTKWHSFRQIGNSVSPIVAEAVLSVIAKRLC